MENQRKPSIAAALIAVLVALPKLLDLIIRVGRALQSHDVLEWLTKLEATVDSLERAKTKNEKIKSAQDIATVISTL